MGWGYGVLPDGREVGYSVEAVCEAPGCGAEIDRGLGCLCGTMHGQDDGEGCGHYFCGEHLFFGAPNQMCGPCLDEWDRTHNEVADEDSDGSDSERTGAGR